MHKNRFIFLLSFCDFLGISAEKTYFAFVKINNDRQPLLLYLLNSPHAIFFQIKRVFPYKK